MEKFKTLENERERFLEQADRNSVKILVSSASEWGNMGDSPLMKNQRASLPNTERPMVMVSERGGFEGILNA